MIELNTLLKRIEAARISFLNAVDGIPTEKAIEKPSPKEWSISEITEHMVWAEKVGVLGMWKALIAHQSGQVLWKGAHSNGGLSIEEVVAQTWETKEQVPEIAKPIWGGPLSYWMSELKACAYPLNHLIEGLAPLEHQVTDIIYPHPISGPLDVSQRLQFLAFHLNRHQQQVERVRAFLVV